MKESGILYKSRETNGADKWDLSSAGRASALQAEGHRFEPCRSHSMNLSSVIYGEIAQLARAHGSYPWCREFESPSRYYFLSGRHLSFDRCLFCVTGNGSFPG